MKLQRDVKINVLDQANIALLNNIAEDISSSKNRFDEDPIDGCYYALAIRNQRVTEFGDDPKNPEQLPLLAEEGNAWIKTAERSVYELGAVCDHAKSIIGHGGFQKWVEDNLNISYGIAINSMRWYRVCFGFHQLADNFKRKSLMYMIARPDFPEKLREFMLTNGEPDATLSEVKQVAEAFKRGDFELGDLFEKQWYEHLKKQNDYDSFDRAKKKNIAKIKNFVGAASRMVKDTDWLVYGERKHVSVTGREAEDLKNIREEAHSLVDGMFPDFVVEDVKPKFKTLKLNRRKNLKV